MFSSPHGDFSFSMIDEAGQPDDNETVFVPSRGFLFFYDVIDYVVNKYKGFSSPHGDFSFSIVTDEQYKVIEEVCFRPLTGISLFL